MLLAPTIIGHERHTPLSASRCCFVRLARRCAVAALFEAFFLAFPVSPLAYFRIWFATRCWSFSYFCRYHKYLSLDSAR